MLRANHPELTELLVQRGAQIRLQPFEAHIDRALTYKYTLRMMLLGDAGTGKTSLVRSKHTRTLHTNTHIAR